MTAIRYCTSQVSIAPFETLSYIPTRTVLYRFRNLSVSHKYRWRGGYTVIVDRSQEESAVC
jgi:hypothetical protein